MSAAGAAAVALGLAAAGWLVSLVPGALIDEAAIGGATVALGVLTAVVGLIQLALVAGLRVANAWIAAAAATVSGLLAVLSLAVTAVLVTETASGGPIWLLLAAGATLLAAIAYGAGALSLASVPA